MKISTSSMAMSSTRNFSSKSISGTLKPKSQMKNLGMDFLGNFEKNQDTPEIKTGNTRTSKGFGISNSLGEIHRMRIRLINEILQRLKGNGAFGNNENYITNYSAYEEYEETTFNAAGRVETEDGRSIDFNIELAMSRSYMEYNSISIPAVNNALTDPLVINTQGGLPEISDQKFLFDLDADGTEEEISMLGSGTGFLALDKNNDGIINDGNELFGTKSGNGFKDLEQYDSDGNGWIDENDPVFSKLKVWYKNEEGHDILLDLKSADVGAIYLGNQKTNFSLYGMGGLNGMVRSTGVFLKESGGSGLVQHIDLVSKKPN